METTFLIETTYLIHFDRHEVVSKKFETRMSRDAKNGKSLNLKLSILDVLYMSQQSKFNILELNRIPLKQCHMWKSLNYYKT